VLKYQSLNGALPSSKYSVHAESKNLPLKVLTEELEFSKNYEPIIFFPVLDSNIDFEFSIKRSKILLLSTTIFSLDILCCSPYYLCSSKIKKLRLISRKNCPSSSLHK